MRPRKKQPFQVEERGQDVALPDQVVPGKTYALRVDIQKFRNFKDVKGRPPVPYLLVFKTKG